MASRTYRVGIVGCGWVSTGHMNGYRGAQATEVVAAADTDSERLQQFSEEYGVKCLYTDYVEMLSKARIDLLSICTWPALHCDMTVEAAKWNVKGIICEKPMALSLSDANKMIEACDKGLCQLLVSHQRRFEGRYVKAKELLDNGEIGKLLRVEVRQGDLFTDDHGIDLVRFYAGDAPARWVVGQVDWQNRWVCRWGHTVEDSAIGYIKFENDVEGYILAGHATEGHSNYSMVLMGTEGVIQISAGNYPAESWVMMINGETSGWSRIDIRDQLIGTPRKEVLGRPTIEYYWIKAWQSLVEDLIDCIENEKESIVSGHQGMKTLEIVAAIYESSRLRTRVHFPLPSEVDKPLELMEKAYRSQVGNEGKAASS